MFLYKGPATQVQPSSQDLSPIHLRYLYVLPNTHHPEILSFLPNTHKITQQTVLARLSIKCFNSPTRRRCQGKKDGFFFLTLWSCLAHLEFPVSGKAGMRSPALLYSSYPWLGSYQHLCSGTDPVQGDWQHLTSSSSPALAGEFPAQGVCPSTQYAYVAGHSKPQQKVSSYCKLRTVACTTVRTRCSEWCHRLKDTL